MAATLTTRGEALVLGEPKVVIEKSYPAVTLGRTYDVSPDGRRFLMVKGSGETVASAAGRIVLVQGFFDELRRLAPPGHRPRPAREESAP